MTKIIILGIILSTVGCLFPDVSQIDAVSCTTDTEPAADCTDATSFSWVDESPQQIHGDVNWMACTLNHPKPGYACKMPDGAIGIIR